MTSTTARTARSRLADVPASKRRRGAGARDPRPASTRSHAGRHRDEFPARRRGPEGAQPLLADLRASHRVVDAHLSCGARHEHAHLSEVLVELHRAGRLADLVQRIHLGQRRHQQARAAAGG